MTGHAPSALDVAGLGYRLGGRTLFQDVNMRVAPGRSIVVTGPSGSGKSTLLMCLLGLCKPSAGRITVDGQEITRMWPRARARLRRTTMGMVFQDGELLPELSPVENVALAALLAGRGRRDAYPNAQRLLDDLGVPYAHTRTDDLSGGERQRTAVARALITEPTVLLADEPTGALDPESRDNVAETLFSLPRERGCALLVVTHDRHVAGYGDQRVRLDAGHLAEVAG
ncbi:ABC transporter ATP-binding protein [Salinactinospora qingdaonensis]|uniref:ABC transporter domain-containing protein n=1 Tax=Salinactinospora qingdaonensis TaxID=702744 RepID=A0ABP7FYB3_9ACTN